MRFSVEPYPGDSGFAQWHDAMRMVARLPGGIPWEFRKRLWLTMAEKHVQHRKVDWERVKRFCFNDRSNPDDNELGVQIVKDLHRTGCSLFCGEDAEHNQALLKRVLLAYARWNKTVGYCQGFNMLAALILEVMEWKEEDALKVMIYLIEGVLPESYFANSLRGLSVDMAVFRDLLRLRLPGLSRHLDHLQLEARDSASGTSYEPPLTNVFTMQWFLTLFSNCLPKATVLRVWDLIFLEGNEVLLRTALTIWDGLADRIMAVESADEFYSIMGVLTREMLEFGLMDANHLVKTVCTMAPFPFPQLPELRDRYTYNITPFTAAEAAVGVAKRGLRLFYSDDEDDNEDDQLAVAAWCFSSVFPPQLSPIKAKGEIPGGRSPSPSSNGTNFSSIGPGAFSSTVSFPDPARQPSGDPDRMSLDISALKKQYAKLRERQKQAHIILTAASSRQPAAGSNKQSSVAMNHLLLGKKPLISKKTKGASGTQGSTQPLKFQFKPTGNRGPVSSQGSIITGTAQTSVHKSTEKTRTAATTITTATPNTGGNKVAKTTKVPITRSEMNIRGSRVASGLSGMPFTPKDRKNSLPTPESGETLHWRDAKRHRDVDTFDTKAFKEHQPIAERGEQQRDDDASSTSTELCDDDAGVISELASDLEDDDDDDTSHGSASTATGATTLSTNLPPPFQNVAAISVHGISSLDRSVRSMDESSDGDTLSVVNSTPTALTAPESIPSVVVSPGGEWSRDDWPDWSRMSVDKEDNDNVGGRCGESDLPQMEESEVVEYVSKSFRNYFGAEVQDDCVEKNDKLNHLFSQSQIAEQSTEVIIDASPECDPSSPAFWQHQETRTGNYNRQVEADEHISKWDTWFPTEEQNKKGDDVHVTDEKVEQTEDDDYTEERRQEWLAKLEIYRRTLGFDNDVITNETTPPAKEKSELSPNPVCEVETTVGCVDDKSLVFADASLSSQRIMPSSDNIPLCAPQDSSSRTAHISSDEFHSLSDSTFSEEDISGIGSHYGQFQSSSSDAKHQCIRGSSTNRRKSKLPDSGRRVSINGSSDTSEDENKGQLQENNSSYKITMKDGLISSADGGSQNICSHDLKWSSLTGSENADIEIKTESEKIDDPESPITIRSFESWRKSKTMHDLEYTSSEVMTAECVPTTEEDDAKNIPIATSPFAGSSTNRKPVTKRSPSSSSSLHSISPTKPDFFGNTPIKNVHTAYVPGSTGSILTNATRRWSSSGAFSDNGATGSHQECSHQTVGSVDYKHHHIDSRHRVASGGVLRRSISKPSSPTKFQQVSNSEQLRNKHNFFGSHHSSMDDADRADTRVSSSSARRYSHGMPVFNPFPTFRKSQIWGGGGVGIKLGLYDTTSGSTSNAAAPNQRDSTATPTVKKQTGPRLP